MLNKTEDELTFSCMENDQNFAAFTLAFIYFPSLNILATLYGPFKVWIMGLVWGIVILIYGLSFSAEDDIDSEISSNLSERGMEMFFVFLGVEMMILGSIIWWQSPTRLTRQQLHSICSFSSILFLFSFPLLLPIIPLIFLIIKILSLIKPNNKFLKAQATLGSRGESILEAAPQFGLQCYIVLLSMSPTWSQWFSLITSAITLSPANIEHYVTARLKDKKRKWEKEEFVIKLQLKAKFTKPPKEITFKPEKKCDVNLNEDTLLEMFKRSSVELIPDRLSSMELSSYEIESMDKFGPMSILKNIAVFLPASLFRIMAVSIFCVFFKSSAMIIILGYLGFLLCIATCGCCFCNFEGEKDDISNLVESFSLSWLTITSLGRGKVAAVLRMASSFILNIAHTIIFIVILAICNTDPGLIDSEFGVSWSDLALVQDLTTLNILLVSTICLGWGALLLDVITAAVKNYYRSKDSDTEDQREKASFWDNAILLEGLKYNWRD